MLNIFQILERLNQVHITLSHETKRNILNDFGEYSTEKKIQGIAQGKDGKLNGDNLDLYVTTNDVRMDNKSKDYYFFATYLTFDRVDCKNLDDSKPVGDSKISHIKTLYHHQTKFPGIRNP